MIKLKYKTCHIEEIDHWIYLSVFRVYEPQKDESYLETKTFFSLKEAKSYIDGVQS